MEPKNYVLHAETGVVRISPYGFLRYAKQFFQAGRSVRNDEGFSPVPYYLFCRSLELGLKAFILAKGDAIQSVKKNLGHNLLTGLARAKHLGLAAVVGITTEEEAEIGKANTYYVEKGFEYFTIVSAITGYPDLPSLDVLDYLADRLITSFEQVCLECV